MCISPIAAMINKRREVESVEKLKGNIEEIKIPKLDKKEN